MGFRIWSLISLLILCSCYSPVSSSRTELALGTVCSISLFEHGKSSIYNEIFSRINEIENLMSVNIPTSDLSRINAAAGIESAIVNKDTFKVIERALHYAELSGGAFDPTVGPLVSLWGIGSENQRLPLQKEIDDILPLINWRNIELNPETNSVFLKQHGMALDLGAIAKGYAADETARIIRSAGIKRAKIDLGGDIYMLGERKDKTPWRVGIQNPDGERGDVIGVLRVRNKTVVTSGSYERFFEKDGKRYHHIFDPSSGYPAENSLKSVTLIAENSIDADAVSTAVFVMGYERGRMLIDSFAGIEAIFIFKDMSVRITEGVDFTLTDKNYRFGF